VALGGLATLRLAGQAGALDRADQPVDRVGEPDGVLGVGRASHQQFDRLLEADALEGAELRNSTKWPRQLDQHGPRLGGSILRFVFWHSIALACLVGLLVMLQAYVPPFTRMVY
jgi:hypothetical protein